MKNLFSSLFIFYVLIIAGCGSGVDLSKKPVDMIIRDLSDEPNFSIILYDMDTEGTFFKTYLHQYQVITEDLNDSPDQGLTGWYEVNKDYFMANIDNMGMEIVSKKDGKVEKNVSPPGYGSYVGNQRYGQWVDRGGSSFWQFYGQYAFMSSMFNMMRYPVQRSYWNDYESNYRGTGRTYYGPRSSTGTTMYGTRGAYNSGRTSSRWNSNSLNSSLKQRVRSTTSRSSRSGSRYSTSSRSRSGGYGK